MLPASADQSGKPIADMDLFKLSAQSAESNHPAIVPLVKPDEGDAEPLKHFEEQDWWTLRLQGQGAKGGKIVLQPVVVGKAAE
jgi:hypothetical protein